MSANVWPATASATRQDARTACCSADYWMDAHRLVVIRWPRPLCPGQEEKLRNHRTKLEGHYRSLTDLRRSPPRASTVLYALFARKELYDAARYEPREDSACQSHASIATSSTQPSTSTCS